MEHPRQKRKKLFKGVVSMKKKNAVKIPNLEMIQFVYNQIEFQIEFLALSAYNV